MSEETREALEEAFREGFGYGWRLGVDEGSYYGETMEPGVDQAWEKSDAKRRLRTSQQGEVPK